MYSKKKDCDCMRSIDNPKGECVSVGVDAVGLWMCIFRFLSYPSSLIKTLRMAREREKQGLLDSSEWQGQQLIQSTLIDNVDKYKETLFANTFSPTTKAQSKEKKKKTTRSICKHIEGKDHWYWWHCMFQKKIDEYTNITLRLTAGFCMDEPNPALRSKPPTVSFSFACLSNRRIARQQSFQKFPPFKETNPPILS